LAEKIRKLDQQHLFPYKPDPLLHWIEQATISLLAESDGVRHGDLTE
jgi:hypothetical protein